MFTLKQIIEILNKENKPLNNLEYILKDYNHNDYSEYVNFDDKNYKRNLIFKNSNYEILLICWKPGQSSKIHDHPKNGCIFKMLEGQLSEFIYNQDLQLTQSTNLNKNTVGYIDDEKGYHKIVNDLKKNAVSIHIYSPPNYKAGVYD